MKPEIFEKLRKQSGEEPLSDTDTFMKRLTLFKMDENVSRMNCITANDAQNIANSRDG